MPSASAGTTPPRVAEYRERHPSRAAGVHPATELGSCAGEEGWAVAECLLDWCAVGRSGDQFVDAVLEQDRGVGADPTREDDDGSVMAARDLCDAEGCLTEDGLGVDAALPGEDPVSADELPPEFDGLGYDLNAGSGHGA